MLPIQDILPSLQATLRQKASVVLAAPPGAGKTTAVPLALLHEPWALGGKLILLEPRRLAARAAAARMAQTLGERVGETVGYRVRLDSKISARTRIEVVTEGVFTRMILDDPALEGVAGVLFDEFHERSLDADLGLAFARQSQALLRDDLRLLVMSATLDVERVSALLDDAPSVTSEGRAFPVETRYLGRDQALRLEDQVVRAVRRALQAERGSVLVFLPGQGEIRRVAERLREALDPSDAIIAPLYGALTPAEQDLAIAPAPEGQRKVVLATSIAETSLTIDGVSVVVDCGLARVPRYDPSSGLTRLETVRVTRAAADQRRGRAGRTGPGVCYRLWDEPETRSLIPFARPEILETDMAGVALALAQWGAKDPSVLALLDPPPAAAFAEARRLLQRLGALDADGVLTLHGKALASLPLPPRLADMVARGARSGEGRTAAEIAALITERGLGGTSTDLGERLTRFSSDRSARAEDARRLAQRWARSAGDKGGAAQQGVAALVAHAYPERVAQARGGVGEYRLASGRGAFVETTDALARHAFLAVAELAGGGARDRILLAAPLEQAELERLFAADITTEIEAIARPDGKVQVKEIRRLGELVLGERLVERPAPELLQRALLGRLRREGLGGLNWGEGAESFRARLAFMRGLEGEAWPDLSDAALIAQLDDWLTPLLRGKANLADLNPGDLDHALRALVPWDVQRKLDEAAPARFQAPTGTSCAIDYAAEAGPTVEIRVQELYGQSVHPTVGQGRIPLILALLSPARRPVQVTRDLPGFWKGSWKDVRTEMKGRYPKHPWPEDPASAAPTTRAKPRGA